MPKKLANLLAGKLSNSGFMQSCLTKKAEPPPIRGVNRANGGWLRLLVRHHDYTVGKIHENKVKMLTTNP